MRFTAAAIVAGAAVATASPQYGYASNTTSSAPGYYSSEAPSYSTPDSYVTEVVTAYTTYCPEPTSLTYNGQTYTVTEATTLTITNCPCTVTKPVYSSVVTTSCPTTAPTYPVVPHYPSSNATVPGPVQPPPTGGYTPPSSTAAPPPTYTGAADKLSYGVAGLLAAAGLVAAL